MATSDPFQQLDNICIQLQCYISKPSIHPIDSSSVIVATSERENGAGIYEYNLDQNNTKLLTKYAKFGRRDKFCVDGHFVDHLHNILYVHCGYKIAIAYDLNNMRLKDTDDACNILKECGPGSKTVHVNNPSSSSMNEIHIVGSAEHCKFDCAQQKFSKIGHKWGRIGKYTKLSYNPIMNQLIILGGSSFNDMIWTFDINTKLKKNMDNYKVWKLNEKLKMPHRVLSEFSYDILLVDNVIFVFYFNAYEHDSYVCNMPTRKICNDIWCLDLLNNTWHKSICNVPNGVKDGSYLILQNNTDIHLLNFRDKLHFRVNTHDLLPMTFIKSRRQYYNPLVIGYVIKQEMDCQIQNIPFVLKQLILKYFPVLK